MTPRRAIIPLPLRRRDGDIVEITWVDESDFARPEVGGDWRYQKNRDGKGYASRREGGMKVLLHRLILDAPAGVEVDHINGNGLDNRRQNLRLATGSENKQNLKLNKRNTSGHRGVGWLKQREKWQAQIMVAGRPKPLGRFANLIDAVAAYDAASAQFHPFASHRRDKNVA